MNTFNAIGYFKGSNNAKLVQTFPSKAGKGEYLKLSFGVSIPEKNQTTFVTLHNNYLLQFKTVNTERFQVVYLTLLRKA